MCLSCSGNFLALFRKPLIFIITSLDGYLEVDDATLSCLNPNYFSIFWRANKRIEYLFSLLVFLFKLFWGLYCLTRLSQCHCFFNGKIPIGVNKFKMFCTWSLNFPFLGLPSLISWLTICLNDFWSSSWHLPGLPASILQQHSKPLNHCLKGNQITDTSEVDIHVI